MFMGSLSTFGHIARIDDDDAYAKKYKKDDPNGFSSRELKRPPGRPRIT